MRLIPLTKGYSAKVDDADFDWLSQWKWSASNSGGRIYAMRAEGPRKQQRFFYMHRVVNDTPKGLATDHINGDTLDNRRANLRSATTSQNAMNARSHRDSASKFKGVHINTKGPKPWTARIMRDGKLKILGGFDTEEAAAAAYQAEAAKLFGDFNRSVQ